MGSRLLFGRAYITWTYIAFLILHDILEMWVKSVRGIKICVARMPEEILVNLCRIIVSLWGKRLKTVMTDMNRLALTWSFKKGVTSWEFVQGIYPSYLGYQYLDWINLGLRNRRASLLWSIAYKPKNSKTRQK